MYARASPSGAFLSMLSPRIVDYIYLMYQLLASVSDKHSSLLVKFLNYCSEKFCSAGQRNVNFSFSIRDWKKFWKEAGWIFKKLFKNDFFVTFLVTKLIGNSLFAKTFLTRSYLEYFHRKSKKNFLRNSYLTILRTSVRTRLRKFFDYAPRSLHLS